MRRLGIRRGDAFALVYSPHEPGSFEEAERLRREIVEAKRDAPLVVAANKSDLPAPPGLGGAQPGGAPPAETVERLWGARYLEVSAKHDHNVAQLFRDLLAQVRLPGGSLSPARPPLGAIAFVVADLPVPSSSGGALAAQGAHGLAPLPRRRTPPPPPPEQSQRALASGPLPPGPFTARGWSAKGGELPVRTLNRLWHQEDCPA
nr:GTP-binding protein Rhes-like [Pogona vitticeps]